MRLNAATAKIGSRSHWVDDEPVWIDDFDTVCNNDVGREITKICGHDAIYVTGNSGRKDVPVIRVG